VPEIRDFYIITGWGDSGRVILQVSIAVFWALSKTFLGKDGSAPLEKIGPYAYDNHEYWNTNTAYQYSNQVADWTLPSQKIKIKKNE